MPISYLYLSLGLKNLGSAGSNTPNRILQVAMESENHGFPTPEMIASKQRKNEHQHLLQTERDEQIEIEQQVEKEHPKRKQPAPASMYSLYFYFHILLYYFIKL